jgi:hypothetical protein
VADVEEDVTSLPLDRPDSNDFGGKLK